MTGNGLVQDAKMGSRSRESMGWLESLPLSLVRVRNAQFLIENVMYWRWHGFHGGVEKEGNGNDAGIDARMNFCHTCFLTNLVSRIWQSLMYVIFYRFIQLSNTLSCRASA